MIRKEEREEDIERVDREARKLVRWMYNRNEEYSKEGIDDATAMEKAITDTGNELRSRIKEHPGDESIAKAIANKMLEIVGKIIINEELSLNKQK